MPSQSSSGYLVITAIIVTYNPQQEQLQRLFERSLPQVDAIVVVDNGSSAPVKQWLDAVASPKIIWRPLGENKGIATAHNEGIKQARAMNADYVLIFDHDSVPSPTMVEQLMEAIRIKQSEGYRVAAVGPCYKDARRNTPPPFLRIEGLRLVRCIDRPENPIVPVEYLVSSGSLIPMSTLDAVGDMNDGLFIDYVDLEWGLRAKTKGYQSFGVFTAFMEHSLGDEPLLIFGRSAPVHSPLRHYYMARNAIWLYRQKEIPLNWKLVDGSRLILRFVAYSLFATPRLQHIQSMTLGIIDGLRGRMGKKRP